MKIYIPYESSATENRVALTPDVVEQLLKKFPDIKIHIECRVGEGINAADDAYTTAGAHIAKPEDAQSADIILRVTPPQDANYKNGAVVIGLLDPSTYADTLKTLAQAKVNAIAMERIPRTSRAQSMDALSSQANLAGYRAVLEAAQHYKRVLPLFMTAAGSTRPAKVVVLGVGVAGLQAIATAKRLGANVEAFDIRAEVAEQVKSLGAKFISFDLGEEGAGEGGYAKELSAVAKEKQQKLLQEYLTSADIVITTAQIPGRKAPVLVTEEAVNGMKAGSVIVDMAAASGGNCPLSVADKVITQNGVTIVGHTNYPSMVAADASAFYAKNLLSLLNLILSHEDGKTTLNLAVEDDIIQAALVVHNGKVNM